MDLKQLEYFVRVAELGSFTRASIALDVAQPALSRQIRLLEVELRQNLLTRNGRGALPTEAGNLRLEGLYFDRQGDTTNRIVTGSTVRVGLSAQSYPFMAPTGVVDYRLRMPGDKQINSAVATFGPYNQYGLELDTQVPLVAEKLSFGGGVSGAGD